MRNRFIVDKSYGLERELEKSIERMRDNATRTRELKQQIVKIRRQRQQVIELPATLDEEGEEEEGENED